MDYVVTPDGKIGKRRKRLAQMEPSIPFKGNTLHMRAIHVTKVGYVDITIEPGSDF